jgi:hypothetical protein
VHLSEPIVDHYRPEISACQLKFLLLLHHACNQIQKLDTVGRRLKLVQEKKIGSQKGSE